MSDTYFVEMNAQGRVVIPAALRKELNLEPGARLAVQLDNGRLCLIPQEKIKTHLRAMFSGLKYSMADQLMSERAQEAALENKK